MTDYRNLPEITAAWREIAELAELDEEMKYDDTSEYDDDTEELEAVYDAGIKGVQAYPHPSWERS